MYTIFKTNIAFAQFMDPIIFASQMSDSLSLIYGIASVSITWWDFRESNQIALSKQLEIM